jgi:protein gp37
VGDHWWDETWNPVGGCSPIPPGCDNCYAQQLAGTQQTAHRIPIYLGTTDWLRGKPIYNGTITAHPPAHDDWMKPFRFRGAPNPLLGPGRPSLLWAGSMCEIFHPKREKAILDLIVGTLACSPHFGLLLTKQPRRMAAYFNAQPTDIQQRWRRKLLLGFSAENQAWFDVRWPPMRELAQQGWFIFVSIAPMLGPVRLPDDFRALGERCWVICSGEEGKDARWMNPDWARHVRDQCAAGIPFFMKQMSGKRPIPDDLFIRQPPAL